MAPSLASFSAPSRARTRSAVVRRRFSSLGSSQRRSVLSRTSWERIRNYLFRMSPFFSKCKFSCGFFVCLKAIKCLCMQASMIDDRKFSQLCSIFHFQQQNQSNNADLFVHFCKLLQVVFQKWNLMLLGRKPLTDSWLQFRALLNTNQSQIEKLAEILFYY